jgi:hypothetical protein
MEVQIMGEATIKTSNEVSSYMKKLVGTRRRRGFQSSPKT